MTKGALGRGGPGAGFGEGVGAALDAARERGGTAKRLARRRLARRTLARAEVGSDMLAALRCKIRDPRSGSGGLRGSDEQTRDAGGVKVSSMRLVALQKALTSHAL
jgi:hypothetical protein